MQLATEHTPGFSVSSYELDADGVSYTYLTLRALQKKYGQDTRLYFITGTDAFLKIDTVDEGGRTFRQITDLSVGTRPGYRDEELAGCIARVRENFHTDSDAYQQQKVRHFLDADT